MIFFESLTANLMWLSLTLYSFAILASNNDLCAKILMILGTPLLALYSALVAQR